MTVLSVGFTLSSIRHNRRSTLVQGIASHERDDIFTHAFTLSLNESRVLTAEHQIYVFIALPVTCLTEYLDEDNVVTASVSHTGVKGLLALQGRVRITLTNPVNNVYQTPITVEAITA